MRLDEFLRLRETHLDAVLIRVNGTVGPGADDVLLAVGSIVEGLGNSKSDLDLLLITTRNQDPNTATGCVTLVVGKCIIDVRILRVDEIDELLTRFDGWSQLPWNVTHAAPFTPDERILLHRLHHGLVLHRGERERVTGRMPSLLTLARLKLYVARQMSRTIQVDMVGYREVGDFRSLVFAAQEVLGHAVDALLAGYQVTNPLPKWRSRMLESLPSDWELPLGIRPSGMTAAQFVWHLHRAPTRPDRIRALKHALRITTFARAVFLWAETKLVGRSAAKSKSRVWPKVAQRASDAPLPFLDFDVDFSLTNGHVTVGRLNEFSGTLKMSALEFRMALLFDGTTTRREAEQLIFGTPNKRGGESRSRNIDNLISEVIRAGFHVSTSRKVPFED